MDLRVERIFDEEMKGDTSFTEKPSPLEIIFGTHKYTQREVRETWNDGIRLGIEIGLRKASIEGQRIELNANTKESKEKEFLEKFYRLADEYNCSIQYHPEHGMVALKKY
jgi:hypothetical protein